jgi:hypothetical protein
LEKTVALEAKGLAKVALSILEKSPNGYLSRERAREFRESLAQNAIVASARDHGLPAIDAPSPAGTIEINLVEWLRLRSSRLREAFALYRLASAAPEGGEDLARAVDRWLSDAGFSGSLGDAVEAGMDANLAFMLPIARTLVERETAGLLPIEQGGRGPEKEQFFDVIYLDESQTFELRAFFKKEGQRAPLVELRKTSLSLTGAIGRYGA